MRQQPTFGVALKALFGLVRVFDQHQLTSLVFVFGTLPSRVGEADHLPEFVVFPSTGFARAIDIFHHLPGVVVGQGFFVAVGVLDRGGLAGFVVGVFGFVAQRIDRFDQVALIIVGPLPLAALGIADLAQQVLIVVGVMHHGVVGADVLKAIATLVVGVAIRAAIRTDMTNHILGVIAEEPLRALIRMANTVGVAKDVVVVPGLVAMGIGDVGQADVFVPFQTGVETAVVGPFADGIGVGANTLPLQIHAATGAVGVTGDQVMLVLIRPSGAVLVLGLNQVAIRIVLVSTELAQWSTVNDLPEADQSALIIDQRAEVQMNFADVVF